MKKQRYVFKAFNEKKAFLANDLFEAKKMAFNYFKTNLIDLVC